MNRIYSYRTHVLLFFSLFLFFTLPSCKKKQPSSPTHFKPLKSYIDFEQTKDNITLRVKRLSTHDCIELFGARGKKISRSGRSSMVPLQLSIKNNTKQLIALKPENISIPLVPSKKISQRLQENTALQIMGAGLTVSAVSGLVGAAGISAFAVGSLIACKPLLWIGFATAACTPAIMITAPIVALVHAITGTRTNRSIKQDVEKKAIEHPVVIEPGATVETLMFVYKRNYTPDFEVSFMNHADGKSVTNFLVSLPGQ